MFLIPSALYHGLKSSPKSHHGLDCVLQMSVDTHCCTVSWPLPHWALSLFVKKHSPSQTVQREQPLLRNALGFIWTFWAHHHDICHNCIHPHWKPQCINTIIHKWIYIIQFCADKKKEKKNSFCTSLMLLGFVSLSPCNLVSNPTRTGTQNCQQSTLVMN